MKKDLDYVSDYQLKAAFFVFYIYICCFIAKSRGMSLTHVKSAIAGSVFLPFTFLRHSSIPPIGYCCSYYAAARYTWKSRLAVVDFSWRHLIAKLTTRVSVRCKDLADICCTSRGIAHFVVKFVAMATRVGWGKIQLAAFDGISKNSPTDAKNLADISYTSRVIANFVPYFVAMAMGVGRRKMRLVAFDGLSTKTLL